MPQFTRPFCEKWGSRGGQLHFVTASCYRRRKLLASPRQQRKPCFRAAPATVATGLTRLQRWRARKKIEKVHYPHRNPVRRGLVSCPEEWKWSSCRAYVRREEETVKVNDRSVLRLKLKDVRRFGDQTPYFSHKAAMDSNGCWCPPASYSARRRLPNCRLSCSAI